MTDHRTPRRHRPAARPTAPTAPSARGAGPVPSIVEAGYLAGIDVSHYQEEVDWPTVAASGVAYAYIKASDGVGRDSYFQSNWAAVAETPILHGPTHFLRPNSDPRQQAETFLRQIGSLGPEHLPPALDIEWTSQAHDEWPNVPRARRIEIAQTWLDIVEQRSGRVPIIYLNAGWWQTIMGRTNFGRYPLWLARYGPRTECPPEWTNWTFWQCSETWRVPGITLHGNQRGTDHDRFRGSLDDLRRWNATTITRTPNT